MSDRLVLVIATASAALLSYWLYGAGVLSPAASAWMLHGDPAQHLVGAMHFLSQSWQWPPGAIAITGQRQGSIVFVDAIPLLAFLAKSISWPVHWQYFGLWMLVCHVGMAWCATNLLTRLGLSPLAALLGSGFFIAAPVLLIRAYGHEALMAQWIILWAMLLGLHAKWRVRPWLLLVGVSLLIHPYLGAMGLAFAVASCLLRPNTLRRPIPVVLSVAEILVWTLAVMWLSGYFVGSSEISATGFGFFSANLLTWIDPMDWMDFLRFHGRSAQGAAEWSQFFASSGQATRGQYEGFAYLGLGVIALVGMSIAQIAIPKQRKILVGQWSNNQSIVQAFRSVGVVAVAMALFSLSSVVTLGPHVLLELPMPGELSLIAGVFRASGRFVWPLTYLLMVSAIVMVGRRRWGWTALLAALIFQCIDLGPKLFELRARFHEPGALIASAATSPHWAPLFRNCPRLVVVGDVSNQGAWAAPAARAIIHGAQVDPVSVARPSAAELQARHERMRRMIQQADWASQTVYLLLPETDSPNGMISTLIGAARAQFSDMQLQQIDGYHVLYSKSCE